MKKSVLQLRKKLVDRQKKRLVEWRKKLSNRQEKKNSDAWRKRDYFRRS